MAENEGPKQPPEGNTSTSSSSGSGRRVAIASFLTKLAHGSAPFISTFLLIHLTAPAMANIGGSQLSSQTMIIGREYYQTAFGQQFLVLTPILAHATAGLAKRLIAPRGRQQRALSSPLALTAYAAGAFFLPVHYLVHRAYPADPAPPIDAFGPSELDFEYVKFGLQRWPVRSALLYAGLAVCVAWHASEGMQIIWNTWLKPSLGALRVNAKTRRIAVAAALLPVFTGLVALYREPMMAFSSSLVRFQAAFTQSTIYRL